MAAPEENHTLPFPPSYQLVATTKLICVSRSLPSPQNFLIQEVWGRERAFLASSQAVLMLLAFLQHLKHRAPAKS